MLDRLLVLEVLLLGLLDQFCKLAPHHDRRDVAAVFCVKHVIAIEVPEHKLVDSIAQLIGHLCGCEQFQDQLKVLVLGAVIWIAALCFLVEEVKHVYQLHALLIRGGVVERFESVCQVLLDHHFLVQSPLEHAVNGDQAEEIAIRGSNFRLYELFNDFA